MKNYIRLMLGKKSVHAEECRKGGFIGIDFGVHRDLSSDLPEDWREFNSKYIPEYLAARPDKTKIAAGLAGGAVWTVAKWLKTGDVVLCPDGTGRYYVGEVTGDYKYEADGVLPHRRPVHWFEQTIERSQMSEALRNSSGSVSTTSDVTKYAAELELLMGGVAAPKLISTDETVEDASAFAMEEHLEAFLIANWNQTELSREYDIYTEDGEVTGRQYRTDTGPLDILCVSKDKKRLLVIELKKGRASDAVVGQILRYMGYVKEILAEEGQTVKGVIIALEDDQRIRRALVMVPDITFYRYEVSFKLVQQTG